MGDDQLNRDDSLARLSEAPSVSPRISDSFALKRRPTVQFGTIDEQSPASFASGLAGVSQCSDESPVISPVDRARSRRSRISVISARSGRSVMNLAGLAAIEEMVRRSRSASAYKVGRPSEASRDLADALEAVEELCHVARDTEMVTMEIEKENYRLREELYASENAMITMQFQDTPLKDKQEMFETWREYQEQIGNLTSETFQKEQAWTRQFREHEDLQLTLNSEIETLKRELANQQRLQDSLASAASHKTMPTSDLAYQPAAKKVMTLEQDLKLAYDAVEKESEHSSRLVERIQYLDEELAAATRGRRPSAITSEHDTERQMLLERVRFLESEVKNLSQVSERTDKKQAALSRMEQLRERISRLQHTELDRDAQPLEPNRRSIALAVATAAGPSEGVTERETHLEARVEDLENRLQKTYSNCPHVEILNIWGSMEKAARSLEDLELALRKTNSAR